MITKEIRIIALIILIVLLISFFMPTKVCASTTSDNIIKRTITQFDDSPIDLVIDIVIEIVKGVIELISDLLESSINIPVANSNGKVVKAKFTAYYPADNKMEGGFYDCKGIKLDPSKNTCAAPACIPYGTKIKVSGTGTSIDGKVYTVTDRGGAIKVKSDGTYCIDILMSNEKQCNKFGVNNGTITILN